MIKINQDERTVIVYELLKLAKENRLNIIQKEKFYEIVFGLEKRTEKQKEKFFRFYNLHKGQTQNYRLCDMERFYNCSSDNVRTAIASIRNSLVNLKDDEKMLILKAIVDEISNNNN